MPHKHKRKRGEDGDYELPPSQRARPLSVRPSREGQAPVEQKRRKGKGRRNDDDTPRAFRRLMAVAGGKKVRSGLDDGQIDKKKKKKTPQTASAPSDQQPATEALKIRPGEDLRAFAARVDAALPVSGLTRKTIVKDGKDEQGIKVYKTRKERKMHKLYDQWRAEEAKIQEKREEELELEAERDLEKDGAGVLTASYLDDDQGAGGRKKKKKGRGNLDDDPWAQLKKKRAETKVGLHDTAQAPPELNKSKARQLKIKGDATVDVDSIPKAAGSLRRREELQEAREEVLEAYRKIREHEQAKLTGKLAS